MDTLSLDASIAITGISRSTLWRRVTDGSIGRGEKDGRSRAMLALGDVLLPPHGEQLATAYDDCFNQTPARLLRQVRGLGYRMQAPGSAK